MSTNSTFKILAAGEYRLWAVPGGQRYRVSILINGDDVGLATISEVGPFSDAMVHLDMDLHEGDEVATVPGDAHLIVRRLPNLNKVYDSHS